MPLPSDAIPFPTLKPHQHARLETLLPSQLYIVDLLPPAQTARLLAWCRNQEMEGPKPAKKGEAERTAYRGSVQSTDIASMLLPLLQPFLPSLDVPKDIPSALSPNIRIYHYPPGTYFRGHYDMPQLDLATRRLSCWTVLIYLTDVEGGGTSFYPHPLPQVSKSRKVGTKGAVKAVGQEKITVQAKAGRVLLHWHGNARGGCMLHEGDEVIKGDKWVLRTDILA